MRKSTAQQNAQVVCFGMLVPALVMALDEFPERNTGALVTQAAEFISDDAAIVACLLRGWNVRSGLIGTTLGNDGRGRRVARELKELGVLGKTRLSKSLATPYEVNVSDRTGQRTYFWQRDAQLLATLDTAPLNLISGSSLVYVDWYDGRHILRPMAEAARQGVPVFLNFEHGHDDSDLLAEYAPRTTICQATTDAAQRSGEPVAVACKLLDAGIKTVFVTLGSEGCIAARRNEMLRAYAPAISVIDGCGAGAAFSAGVIYGYLRHWDLEDVVRFAIAAASLKCTVVGPRAFPRTLIRKLASEIRVEHLSAL